MDVRTPIPTNGGDWLSKFGDLWKKQVTLIRESLGASIEEVRMPPDYPTDVPIIYARREEVIGVLKFLKEHADCDYQFLADITATDEHLSASEFRFEVVYNLFSVQNKNRIRVKTRARENEEVPTATGLWSSADWVEREVYDMFGVRFQGHPDLRRILMDVRWIGHPLRKDYPLRGYQLFTNSEPNDPSLLEQ